MIRQNLSHLNHLPMSNGTSNYNKQYENTLRPLMNKYDIVRVYAFRLLESNELYVDPFTPNHDPYDIKITLES